MKVSNVLASLAVFAAVVVSQATNSPDDKPWGYRENDPQLYGPSQWSTKYPTCTGKRQSPIDISTRDACKTKATTASPLQFRGECTQFKLKQSTYELVAEGQNGTCTVSTASSSDRPFSFVQFHIHTPSEHTVNGKAFDAEAHFVFKNADDTQFRAIGVFLQKEANAKTAPPLTGFWQSLKDVSANKTVPAKLDSVTSLLSAHSASSRVFNYPGSFTSPGCREIMDWWVIEEPLVVGAAEFDEYVKLMQRLPATKNGDNARPVQPLHNRKITVY